MIRLGIGLSYGQLTGFNYIGGGNSQGMGFNTVPFSTASFGDPAFLLASGIPAYNSNSLFGATYDPGLAGLGGGNDVDLGPGRY